jgi:hypothetical protein
LQFGAPGEAVMVRWLGVLLLISPTLAWGHGGGLDANGCHHDRKNGGYHCHRAPAARPQSYPQAQPLTASSQPAQSTRVIYRCVDSNGIVNFTSTPRVGCVVVSSHAATPSYQASQSFMAAPAQSAASTYYANCAAARAAGAAPVRAGQPGYSRKLDRDGDGVGCE